MARTNILTQKCRYALRAIFELALRDSTEPVKIHDIASAQAIPPRFLEVILSELRHGGFVESRRGNDGGYILARSPRSLTIGEVISFLQGGSYLSYKAEKVRFHLMGDYAFTEMWGKISTAISDTYDNTTFAYLVERELVKRKQYIPDYAI